MKKGLIILIVLAALILIIAGYYFSFVYMSESKAKEIIRQDFYKDQQKVCNLFYVFNNQTCPAFANCYIERAVSAIPSKLLTPIAKDIKYGNSSAVHTYEIINGKKIGEGCLSEILSLSK